MCAHSSSLANTVEVSSTDLRNGAAFDNVKASWNQVSALRLESVSLLRFGSVLIMQCMLVALVHLPSLHTCFARRL